MITKERREFTRKFYYISQTQAAQINPSTQRPSEGVQRDKLARCDSGGNTSAGARAERGMMPRTFSCFQILRVRKFDKMASPATGLTSIWRAAGRSCAKALPSAPQN